MAAEVIDAVLEGAAGPLALAARAEEKARWHAEQERAAAALLAEIKR